MGARSGVGLLQLPVRLHGIRLGQPVDLLVDTEHWRALGFVVLCGDETQRFLPFAAAVLGEDEIGIGSALIMLEDVDFYRRRAVSLRSLLGGPVGRAGAALGLLRDVLVDRDGLVEALTVERDGAAERVDAAGTSVVATRASAA